MEMSSDTERSLSQMNDAAAFERLAAAVLRAASPMVYGNLSHPGVKPGGKTVKAPFDNVGWLLMESPPRFVCAAHTTEQNDLKGKWLHDPARVIPKKPGSKPTKPAGDLIKGISEIRKLREEHPELAVTYALTTNCEPSVDLRSSVESLAKSTGIHLDIWSVSRIAHFLDTDPTGQIIRRNHLGAPVKLLSRQLLLQIGRRSLQDHLPFDTLEVTIRRENFNLERTDTLVVGASGMGKTTSCATALDSYITDGLPAIVLKSEFLLGAASIEIALEAELRRQEPDLEAGAGRKALLLCMKEDPLTILIEDVNRVETPALLLNKILGWTRAAARSWRVILPIWPQHLDVIEDKKRTLENVDLIYVEKYTSSEAIKAISKRADRSHVSIDELHIQTLADQLGHDPFLIGIYDMKSTEPPADVINQYIEDHIKIIANRSHRMPIELTHTINNLLHAMLQHGVLSPNWSQITSWIPNRDTINLLTKISLEGNLLRINNTNTDGTLEFRHDRLLHKLLSGAITEAIGSEEFPHYVTDPFFSEATADAIVKIKLPLSRLLILMDSTPVTAAHALRIASEIDSDYADTAAEALYHWLHHHSNDADFSNRRYAIARTLSEVSSTHVLSLVSSFGRDDYFWHPLLAAAFKNGNFSAGFTLLQLCELGTAGSTIQNLTNSVLNSYRDELLPAIKRELGHCHEKVFNSKVGALRLAGYIGCSSLAESIQECWDQDRSKIDYLSSYIFAAARCSGDNSEITLGPICDAWESLPDETNSTMGQPAERIAAENVAWAFITYTPSKAIQYFIYRSKRSEKLRWPITYMLRAVDHPDAVEHLARYSAENSNFIAPRILKSDWERGGRNKGRKMSIASKDRLMSIACNVEEIESIRQEAFAFWALTLEDRDLKTTRTIRPESPLYERALWVRARMKDQSVISELVNKVPEDPVYWLQIERYLWSEELTDTLPPLLDRLAESPESFSDLEFSLARALYNVDPHKVTSMLEPRWASLKSKPMIVQILLLMSDAATAKLAQASFDSSPHPCELLRHFSLSSFKYLHRENPNHNQKTALNNIKPYLNHFTNNELVLLAHECTKGGLTDFRTKYIDPIINPNPYAPKPPSEKAVHTQTLDLALLNEPGTIVNRYQWLGRQLENGIPRTKIIDELLAWLKLHTEDRALFIVGDILSNEATRSEFYIFETVFRERNTSAEYVNSIRFDVFSRTLI